MKPTRIAVAAAVAAATLCAPTLSQAADYFVSQTGSDSHLGRSKTAPWRDLQKAVNRLQPGDTLNIVGPYQLNRSVTISSRGTTAPISIRGVAADGSKGPVPVTCTSSVDRDYCIGFWGASYASLSNLVFDGTVVPTRVKTMVYISHSDHITVADNFFKNVAKYGVYLDGDFSRDHHHVFDHNVFENSSETALYLNRSVDLTVTNNTVRNFTEGDGIVVADTRNATITGNKVSGLIGLGPQGNGRDGIKVRPSENVLVQGNQVSDVKGVGIYFAAPEDAVVYKRSYKAQIIDNEVTHVDTKNVGNNDPDCNQGGWPSALNVTRTDDVDVLSNRVYENYGEGITLSETTQARVKYNNAHDNFGVNYYLNNAAHVVVDSNLAINDPEKRQFYRCEAPAGGIGMANETSDDHNNFVALTDITITNNILAKSRFGINFYWEPSVHYHATSGLNGVTIRNNTVYHAYTHSLFVSRSRHGGNRIESNIFAQVTNNAPDVIENGPRGFTCTANLWWSIQNPGVCASGSDVRGNPQFVNAGGVAANDYRITASSPAIDAARYSTVMPDISWDYFGTKRAFGAWDIGAHEYR